ncbi:hypothetical protein [Undibacterium sp. Tian12W]|uniref:hypothetical protein n=1 Tax=Undibacterium sp. Tian12W TaxID=3413054 RepID=UPI003BF164C5
MRLKNTATLLTLAASDDHEKIIAELALILKLLSLAHKKIAQTNLLLHYFERAKEEGGEIVIVSKKIVEIDGQDNSFDICARKIVAESLPNPQRIVRQLRLCAVQVVDLENPDVAIGIDDGELTVSYWRWLDEVNYTEAQFAAHVLALKNEFRKYVILAEV